jgi:hypothetical protein
MFLPSGCRSIGSLRVPVNGFFMMSVVGMHIMVTWGLVLKAQYTDPGVCNKEVEYLEHDRKAAGGQVRLCWLPKLRGTTFIKIH